MKKSFQKNLIAASVGAVLAAGSMAAVAGTPGTTNLLFPYVTTQTGSYTFISIVAQAAGSTVTPIHFTYATKAISAANTAACTHLNGDGAMTDNDLMLFEIQNKVDMKTQFGDTTSTPKYFPNTAAAANQHGMLIVNNNVGATYGGAPAYAGRTLYGEARIINTASGLAAGYSTEDLHTTGSGNPNFADGTGPDGAVYTKVISWFPTPAVVTSWYALPVLDEANMAFGGNVRANYQVLDNTVSFGGHYNNNETFQSSTATSQVVCLGTFNREVLLGDLNAPWSVNGGWGNFSDVNLLAATAPGTVYADGTVQAGNTLVYKMETTGALGGTTSFITREPVL